MLKEFAGEISTAVAGGKAMYPLWFDNSVGLCSNLSHYMNYKYLIYDRERKFLRSVFNNHIELRREYANEQYPFNVNALDYCFECENGTVYENQYRLAFIEALKNDN